VTTVMVIASLILKSRPKIMEGRLIPGTVCKDRMSQFGKAITRSTKGSNATILINKLWMGYEMVRITGVQDQFQQMTGFKSYRIGIS
jgi:hypothetical protein